MLGSPAPTIECIIIFPGDGNIMTHNNNIGKHETDSMARHLLTWYDRHRRDLPWRARSGEYKDPYRVWLSEIMLQQTTVAAVRDHFIRFVTRWPTVEALAQASLDEVLRQWAGLGYYARARNLHKCAIIIMKECKGCFPRTEEALRSLPGIGVYTAAAIAAIAFDQPTAAVDGNVERIMARLFAVDIPLPDAKPVLRAHAETLVTNHRPGDFAQAMMDLGATVCTPKKAHCLICPWSGHCLGRRRGIACELPRKRHKAARPTRSGVAFWIERADGSVLLRRRPENGLLGGMLEVPSTPWTTGELPHTQGMDDPAASAPCDASWQAIPGQVEHTFTHFHLVLEVWRSRNLNDNMRILGDNYRWVARDALDGEALPSIMRKIVCHVDMAANNRQEALKPASDINHSIHFHRV